MKPIWLFVLAGLLVAVINSHQKASYTPTPVTAGSVVVPYYGASYGPPNGFSSADAKRVVELLESIDRRLEALEQKGQKSAVVKPDLLTVAKGRCLSCHSPSSADDRGGGFILLSDDKGTALKPLSAREKNRVREAVQSGTMPPNRKLDPAEKSAFE